MAGELVIMTAETGVGKTFLALQAKRKACSHGLHGLFVSGEMLAEHLKLLGRITRLAGREDVRQKLLLATSAAEVMEFIREEEKDFPQI